jgi:RNA polymerase sigma-70 factor (ECF subfamily)
LEFISQHQESVLRYCYYLSRNEQAAQDLAQETFIKALTNFEKKPIADILNIKSYLFQIAKNIFIDLKRKNKFEQAFNQSTLGTLVASISAPHLEVWQALFSMDEADQEIILLIDREELSLIEAAGLLKISEAAAKSRLFRARDNFKKIWNK